ncbi:hypothetical protein [Kitasatospora sp. NPDC096140]|uniref:hypothetical protein n=1 Tax=Kitasatospora sp. NPDC096140 TaxID=3155425 RepID=UPI00332875A7
MSRRTILVVVSATVLTAAAAAAPFCFAGTSVTLPLGSGGAECELAWKKDGVTFRALTPGSSPTAFRLVDATGTATIDLASVGNPVALANSVYIRATTKGGFALTDAAGHYVQISNSDGSLTGDTTFVVQTTVDPAGTRMPVLNVAARPTITPDVRSVVPPRVDLALSDARLSVQPEFADAVNEAFGAGSVAPGDLLATCGGTVTA